MNKENELRKPWLIPILLSGALTLVSVWLGYCLAMAYIGRILQWPGW